MYGGDANMAPDPAAQQQQQQPDAAAGQEQVKQQQTAAATLGYTADAAGAAGAVQAKVPFTQPWSVPYDILLMQIMGVTAESHPQPDAEYWNLVAMSMSQIDAHHKYTAQQCMDRWRHALAAIPPGPDSWTQGEQYLLAKLHSEVGSNWAALQRAVPHRSEQEVTALFEREANNAANASSINPAFLPLYIQAITQRVTSQAVAAVEAAAKNPDGSSDPEAINAAIAAASAAAGSSSPAEYESVLAHCKAVQGEAAVYAYMVDNDHFTTNFSQLADSSSLTGPSPDLNNTVMLMLRPLMAAVPPSDPPPPLYGPQSANGGSNYGDGNDDPAAKRQRIEEGSGGNDGVGGSIPYVSPPQTARPVSASPAAPAMAAPPADAAPSVSADDIAHLVVLGLLSVLQQAAAPVEAGGGGTLGPGDPQEYVSSGMALAESAVGAMADASLSSLLQQPQVQGLLLNTLGGTDSDPPPVGTPVVVAASNGLRALRRLLLQGTRRLLGEVVAAQALRPGEGELQPVH